MSSGGSVATAVKTEEMESGVIVAIICDREIVIYLIYLTK
jgi:hypothetical protein